MQTDLFDGGLTFVIVLIIYLFQFFELPIENDTLSHRAQVHQHVCLFLYICDLDLSASKFIFIRTNNSNSLCHTMYQFRYSFEYLSDLVWLGILLLLLAFALSLIDVFENLLAFFLTVLRMDIIVLIGFESIVNCRFLGANFQMDQEADSFFDHDDGDKSWAVSYLISKFGIHLRCFELSSVVARILKDDNPFRVGGQTISDPFRHILWFLL